MSRRPLCRHCGVEWETDYMHTCPSVEERTLKILGQIAGVLERIEGHLANPSQTDPENISSQAD